MGRHSTDYDGCGIYALYNVIDAKIYIGQSRNITECVSHLYLRENKIWKISLVKKAQRNKPLGVFFMADMIPRTSAVPDG